MSETVRAYDLDAAAYATGTAPMTDTVRAGIEDVLARVGVGGSVLEIGSGSGRDAQVMEEHGLVVRRTDITPGFVHLLRAQGHDCDLLDPLVDDLSRPEGPHDAVWANASLLHVARAELPGVLSRLLAVTRPGGVLRASFKEGDGDGWSTHGAVRNPRHFTYWRPRGLARVATQAGWAEVGVRAGPAGTRGETWLELTAVRG